MQRAVRVRALGQSAKAARMVPVGLGEIGGVTRLS